MDFDVIIIGAGPGGYVTAIRASQLGLKTAIVERENLGGVCLNWGCIPTKALLKSGEMYEHLGHLEDYGLSVTGRAYDFTKVIERSRGVAKQLSSGVAFLMKKHKVEVIEGEAKLEKASPAPKVVVALKAGGSRTVSAKHVILATGARARVIPAVGMVPDGERIWTYREAMVPKACPKSLIVIGSGAIGIEFASFYRALGAEVTVIEALDRILPVEDEEVSKAAHKASHEGVHCVEAIAGLKGSGLSAPIPGCTYANPQVASVGLTEAAAKAAGTEVKVGRFPFRVNGKAIAAGETEGFVKVVFDAKTGALIGAHMIGAEVTEMIQGFVIAMTLEATEEDLFATVFAHPTLSEAMHEASLDAYGRVLHI